MTEEETKIAKEKYGINEKQLAFCELYLQNGNAQKSYMIAYENENMNTSGVNGSKLLKKENIAKYIAEGKKKIHSQNRIATEEDILKFWTSTMTNPEYKVIERVKASELLAKNKGMLNDKIDITHDVEINLGFDPTELIEHKIIDQKHKQIEANDEYYDAEYVYIDESFE